MSNAKNPKGIHKPKVNGPALRDRRVREDRMPPLQFTPHFDPPPPPPSPLPEMVWQDKPVIDTDGKRADDFTMPVGVIPYIEAMPLDELKLALASGDTLKARNLLSDLCNPTLKDLGITTLAARNGIKISELLDLWRSHKGTAALGVISDGLSKVAADTVEDALTVTVCCNRCDGSGMIQVDRPDGPVWITCKTCKGSGEVRKVGCLKSREFVLKAGGLIKPDGSQIAVQQNITVTTDSVLDELERIPSLTLTPQR